MRLLVVDDEVRLAESIARALRAEGFDVDVVHDGDDGFWRAQEVDYAAIVLDIMLPGRNGYVVCRDLRAAGVSTPILMLTAKDGEYDEAEALDMGADDYLRKPFSLVVLLARLRALLRRGPATSLDTIEVGELTIDRGQLSARWNDSDEPITFTQREFAVLEHLARRAPDVVSKSGVLDAVWGIDFDGDPNIVEVYIGYLRRKLGRDAVRTVRHVGYQLTGSPGRPTPGRPT
jgi:two-component system, OmpR family, response regulator